MFGLQNKFAENVMQVTGDRSGDRIFRILLLLLWIVHDDDDDDDSLAAPQAIFKTL